MANIERRLTQLERDARGKDVSMIVYPGDPIPDLPKDARGIVISYDDERTPLPGLPVGINQIVFALAYIDV